MSQKTDHAMDKNKTLHKLQHRKLNIDQHEPQQQTCGTCLVAHIKYTTGDISYSVSREKEKGKKPINIFNLVNYCF